MQIVIISLFTCFSFYYTEKVVEFSKSRDPIMEKIKSLDRDISPVNGILSSDTMLVGKSGISVDVDNSYEQMKRVNEYNENLLEFISIKPSILKSNNLDKFIVGTNTDDKKLSLVFSFDDLDFLEEVVYVLDINDVSSTFFIDGKFFESNYLKIKNLVNDKISFGLYGYDKKYNGSSIRYVKNLISNGFSYSDYCLYVNDEFFKAFIGSRINTIKPYVIKNNVFNYFKNTIPNISSATKEGFTNDVTISSGILFGYHPMLVLASANVSYDDTPYRQVKRLLPVINLIINDYTKYLVDENNTN